VIATDRWLLGPPGTGALWLADPLGDRLQPDLIGANPGASGMSRTSGAAGADATGATGATGAAAFEPGTLPVASAVGVARSCGWLSMYVGLDWVLARPTALARQLRDRLSTIPGVTLLTPAGSVSAVLALRIVGWEPDEAVAELGRRVFAIAGVTAEPPDGAAIRFSLAAFNDEAELERLAAAVELLAAHTPETLPRRTALTILPAP
jgi:selenocysteine lyase/cysteine desulfurase